MVNKAGGRSHFESDLLRHPLCLVGQHNWITVAPSFLTGVFPQLKLLHQKERCHFSDCDHTLHTSVAVKVCVCVCLMRGLMETAAVSYCCQPLVHLRPSLLHSGLLDEAARQLTVVLRNPGCSLFHHLPLLRGRCLGTPTFHFKTTTLCVCVDRGYC